MKIKIKSLVILIFLSLFLSISHLSSGSSYNKNIEGKSATWKVTEYDVDAFFYIKYGSKISIEVINATENEVNVLLSSTDFVEEEPIIDYNNERCFPFIVSPSFLNSSHDLVTDIHNEILFDVERTIVTIIIQDADIKENKKADFILLYDLETGLLIKWDIIQDFGEKSFHTTIELIDTNFWEFEKINILELFYEENKVWILPLATLFIGTISLFFMTKTLNALNKKK